MEKKQNWCHWVKTIVFVTRLLRHAALQTRVRKSTFTKMCWLAALFQDVKIFPICLVCFPNIPSFVCVYRLIKSPRFLFLKYSSADKNSHCDGIAALDLTVLLKAERLRLFFLHKHYTEGSEVWTPAARCPLFLRNKKKQYTETLPHSQSSPLVSV